MSNDESDSQMSAMFDDELPLAQCDLLLRRLERDAALRARWGRYAVVAAVLRSEPLAVCRSGHADIASRLRVALEAEPALAMAAARNPAPRTNWYKPALGAALAAGVAALAITVLRVQTPMVTDADAPVATLAPAVTAAPAPLTAVNRSADAAPSYVVPPSSEQLGVRTSAQLANYVVAHSEYTSPVARLNRLSSFMTSDIDADDDGADVIRGDGTAVPDNAQNTR
jgi:sigma-E factor negative regulatory protein RseA